MKGYVTIALILLLNYSVADSQFIEEIIKYNPAPGQFINLLSTGSPDAAFTIRGEDPGLVSLGSMGGYIVFRFSSPITNNENHPFGVDFTLFGNSLPEWAEPAAVYVMKDENNNGIADDTWYLLAGSDYFFSTTDKDHKIKYYQPQSSSGDIKWVNNLEESGYVLHNSFHVQPYYPEEMFSAEFYQDSCEFNSIMIRGKLNNDSGEGIKSLPRRFGFADNNPSGNPDLNYPDNPYTKETEGYGGDPFDLSWAVNEEGHYVDLDTAHFVKVQTALYSIPGVLGEISTELRFGRLTDPSVEVSGPNEILIIEDIPDTITPGPLKLRAYFFKNGRYVPEEAISWVVENEEVSVDSNGILEISRDMDLVIYASAKNGQILSDPVRIKESGSLLNTTDFREPQKHLSLYPNPVADYFHIRAEGRADIVICDVQGRIIKQIPKHPLAQIIRVSDLPPGIYFLKAQSDGSIRTKKFIKQ